MKKESDKASFVAQEFERRGRKISSAAISALVDATGSDTRELAAACSQIAFDTSAAKAIIDEVIAERIIIGSTPVSRAFLSEISAALLSPANVASATSKPVA